MAVVCWSIFIDQMTRVGGVVVSMTIPNTHVLADLYHRYLDASIATSHGDLYALRRGAFDYPPIVAYLFAPFHAIGFTQTAGLWTFGSVAALAIIGAIVLHEVTSLAPASAWWWSAVVFTPLMTLASIPVQSNFLWGQFGLLIIATCLVDLFVLPERFRGTLIGCVAAIKILPGLFIVWFLARRQWGGARRLVGAAAAVTAIGWILAPHYSAEFFFHVLPSGKDITLATGEAGAQFSSWTLHAGMLANQSLKGLLSRPPFLWTSTSSWLLVAVPVALWGVALTVVTLRRERELTAFIVLWATITLLSPVSWLHYFVYVVVLPGVVVAEWRRSPLIAGGAAVFFATTMVNLENPALTAPPAMHLAALAAFSLRNCFVLGAGFFLACVSIDTLVTTRMTAEQSSRRLR